MTKKIKIMTIGDHPLSPSGVGTQTKYMIECLLRTGKYEFISIGGAIKHENYNAIQTAEWGTSWTIVPVDGYGNGDIVRGILRSHRPDILWFMTDPRFYGWLWQMEDEIRPLVPMVYYHVWDNFPLPKYNKVWYDSTDAIVSISKVTNDIVAGVAPDVELHHIPHAVDVDVFKTLEPEIVDEFKGESLSFEEGSKGVTFFWNNRNARRKQPGTLIYWFKEFLDRVGHKNACLIMHTDPKDPHGQDLEAILAELGLTNGQVRISREKIPSSGLALMYNMADCTINISDAEGFGLSTLESLSCGTPIIVNMTGGLQEQVTDGENWFGVGIKPCSRAVIGSQNIPYIYEDRLNKEQFIDALEHIYNLSPEERKELGRKGQEHVMKNYSFETFGKKWDETLTQIHENHGSWDTRKNYKTWRTETL